MPMVAAAAITAVGSMAAAKMGQKKGGGASSGESGFAALPQEVKDAWLKTYLPQTMAVNDLPYQAVPMKRATAPQSIFDSQALWDLQQYSDGMGGYFSPYKDPNAPKPSAADLAAAAQAQQAQQAPQQMSGADSYDNYLANRFLEGLQPKSKSDNQARAVYDLVNNSLGDNRAKLGDLGKALSAQNYQPGSGLYDLNAILGQLNK